MESKAQQPFVAQLDLKLSNKLKADLIDQGFELTLPPHTIFSAKKKGVSCTLYQSGKLVVQGSEKGAFIEFYLEPHILGTLTYTYGKMQVDATARIGIDESGKGDFFGPLCIAGVYASGETIEKLYELGVKDSKTITDKTILKLGKAIRQSCVHHIVRINPLKYNELYTKFGNLNHLLAWGHATTIEQLVQKTECRHVVVDQFADESVVSTALKRKQIEVSLFQRHRAEEDLVVAAASILAREAFVDGLDKLSREFGITLPKGASAGTIQTGRELVQKYGRDVLEKVAKLHFKTAKVI